MPRESVQLRTRFSDSPFSSSRTIRNSCFQCCLVLFSITTAHNLQAQNADIGDPPTFSASPKASPRTSGILPETTSNWYDISNRNTVRDSWNLVFAPTATVPTGWTGDVASDIPGTTTPAFKDAVATRINWFRAMAGVPTGITLDATFSAKDQQAALMFSANRQISHTPPASWIDYTQDAAQAAGNSNICYGFYNDPGCLVAYMLDLGSNNAAVGHRRWVLYPQTQTMGTGDVPQSGPPANPYPPANALWVFDGNFGTRRPATRDTYVAWPPPGFVPYQVVGARWSFSYPSADFTNAAVSVVRNGAAVPVRLEAVANGYGENTIVWVPDNLDASQYVQLTPPAQDTTSVVTINGVLISGVATSFTYSVTVFDPSVATAAMPAASTVSPASGRGSGSQMTFTFSDPGGWQQLSVVNVLVNNGLDAQHGCYLAYLVSSGTLALVNDNGDAGGPFAGTIALGSSGIASNSQCTVGLVSAGGAGTALTLVVNFTFQPGFGGNKVVYTAARDVSGGNSDWQRLGVWQVPFTPGASISVTGITPARNAAPAGTAQLYTFTWTDTKGAADIGITNILVNNGLDAKSACYLAYIASINTVVLVDDAGHAGGPFMGALVPGAATTIQNSQCSVSGAGGSVVSSGGTLTLTLHIAFQPGLRGNQIIYVAGRDVNNLNNTDWQPMGTAGVQ